MKNANVFEKIKDLNIPYGKYVVVGGVTLVAHGIREWNDDIDIDLAVSPEIFEDFANRGWLQIQEPTKTVMRHGVYDMGVGFGEWSLDELLADALIIEGIPFINLNKLAAWKRQRNLPRDRHHIEIIEQHQENN